MKKFLFLLFSTVFGLNAQQKQFKHQFDNFLQLHNKHYENIKEYSQKLENFNHNLNLIQENNKDYDNCRLYLSKHSTDGKGKDFSILALPKKKISEYKKIIKLNHKN